MLLLKTLEKTEEGICIVYSLEHNDSTKGTTLREDLRLVLDPVTGAVKGNLDIRGIAAENIQEGLENLATWCERFAIALREPMKCEVSVPIFVKDYKARDILSTQEVQG
jgi:hypothetical protein